MDLISFTNPPEGEALAAVRDFARRSERVAPLRFVGRDDLFEEVESQVRSTQAQRRSQSNGIFIQGAPGVGKSCFIEALEGVYRDSTVEVLNIEAETLSSPREFVSCFYKHMEKGKLRNQGGALALSVEVGDARVSASWKRAKQSVTEDLANGASVWEVIGEVCEDARDRVFLVCVDEAQRIEADAGSRRNRIGVSMHGAKTGDIKVVPLFAGLGDTSLRLREIGISREPKDFVRLSTLSEGESFEAAEAFFEHDAFDIEQSLSREDRDTMARSFAIASEGWPRHLHCYLRTLAEAIVKDCDLVVSTGQIDFDAVLERGHDLRIGYARKQLRSIQSDAFRFACMDVAGASEEGQALSVLDLKAAARQRGSSKAQIEKYYDQAVHCGVVEVLADMKRDFQEKLRERDLRSSA